MWCNIIKIVLNDVQLKVTSHLGKSSSTQMLRKQSSSCYPMFVRIQLFPHPNIFPSFPSFLQASGTPAHAVPNGPRGLIFVMYARCSSLCILHTFRSVNPPHWQWPAPMGSWRVFYVVLPVKLGNQLTPFSNTSCTTS